METLRQPETTATDRETPMINHAVRVLHTDECDIVQLLIRYDDFIVGREAKLLPGVMGEGKSITVDEVIERLKSHFPRDDLGPLTKWPGDLDWVDEPVKKKKPKKEKS